MDTVERIRQYTERDRLARNDTPKMKHITINGSTVALCGYRTTEDYGDFEDVGEIDCVVCVECYGRIS